MPLSPCQRRHRQFPSYLCQETLLWYVLDVLLCYYGMTFQQQWQKMYANIWYIQTGITRISGLPFLQPTIVRLSRVPVHLLTCVLFFGHQKDIWWLSCLQSCFGKKKKMRKWYQYDNAIWPLEVLSGSSKSTLPYQEYPTIQVGEDPFVRFMEGDGEKGLYALILWHNTQGVSLRFQRQAQSYIYQNIPVVYMSIMCTYVPV